MLSIDTLVLLSLSLVVTAWLLPGLAVTSVFGPILAVITLALMNNYLWSTALFFQIPDSLTAQTFLTLVANGALFWIVVKLLPGIEISGVVPALVAPVLFTLLSIVAFRYGRNINWIEVWQVVSDFIQGIRDSLLSSTSTPAPPSTP